MSTLILKLGAAGDVVRTTTLLHVIDDEVTWITDAKNLELVCEGVRVFSWEDRRKALDRCYQFVINLEDEIEVARFLSRSVEFERFFGAYMERSDPKPLVGYTVSSAPWFNMSMSSVFDKATANRLKFDNRRSYQEIIFSCLGKEFKGQKYSLPKATPTDLHGDIAISPFAGPTWPNKGWFYYEDLKKILEKRGYSVNFLPRRDTLREHLADVQQHRLLVSGDSLPMHLALGSGIPCVTLFNCTSPWEIYDYGLQTKLISPLLEGFWYQRGFEEKATDAIRIGEVLEAVEIYDLR